MARKTKATQPSASTTPRPSVLIKKELAKLYPGEKFKVRFRPYSDGDVISIDYANPTLHTEHQAIYKMARSFHPDGPLFTKYDQYFDL